VKRSSELRRYRLLLCDQAWNWNHAGKEFERAVALNPNDSPIRVLYGLHFHALSKYDEGLQQVKRAAELDRLNLNALDNLAQSYGAARQFDLTIEQSKKTMEIDPNIANIHPTLLHVCHEQGKYDLWLQDWEKFARSGEDASELAMVEAAKPESIRNPDNSVRFERRHSCRKSKQSNTTWIVDGLRRPSRWAEKKIGHFASWKKSARKTADSCT
jgi:tetratricopeptide (TPR) repeat protein